MFLADVNLRHFRPGPAARILYIERDLVTRIAIIVPRCFERELTVFEFGIRQSVPKRKQRLLPVPVVSSVPHKNAIPVDDISSIALGIITLMRGIVFPAPVVRNRQPARRADVPEQQIGQRNSPTLSCVPRLH